MKALSPLLFAHLLTVVVAAAIDTYPPMPMSVTAQCLTVRGAQSLFLRLAASMQNGSLASNSEMKLPTYMGNYVDAPGHIFDHYFDAGFDVDTLDLAVLNGVFMGFFLLHIPKGMRRVLFRTLNFDTTYVGFMKRNGGIDYLSVAADDNLIPFHLIFLEKTDIMVMLQEIVLVEGLKLEDVPAGVYTIHCPPLRLLGAEGSPIRCILIK
ncbi:hypothetical protein ACJRO7_034682 [Eucalyptus globulus]|uniref:Uncharacterized protein n=1 Tax=Eucalyptus globulus TaxID=34317 RepID=A0ABD3J6T3_EUCGL